MMCSVTQRGTVKVPAIEIHIYIYLRNWTANLSLFLAEGTSSIFILLTLNLVMWPCIWLVNLTSALRPPAVKNSQLLKRRVKSDPWPWNLHSEFLLSHNLYWRQDYLLNWRDIDLLQATEVSEVTLGSPSSKRSGYLKISFCITAVI